MQPASPLFLSIHMISLKIPNLGLGLPALGTKQNGVKADGLMVGSKTGPKASYFGQARFPVLNHGGRQPKNQLRPDNDHNQTHYV